MYELLYKKILVNALGGKIAPFSLFVNACFNSKLYLS